MALIHFILISNKVKGTPRKNTDFRGRLNAWYGDHLSGPTLGTTWDPFCLGGNPIQLLIVSLVFLTHIVNKTAMTVKCIASQWNILCWCFSCSSFSFIFFSTLVSSPLDLLPWYFKLHLRASLLTGKGISIHNSYSWITLVGVINIIRRGRRTRNLNEDRIKIWTIVLSHTLHEITLALRGFVFVHSIKLYKDSSALLGSSNRMCWSTS